MPIGEILKRRTVLGIFGQDEEYRLEWICGKCKSRYTEFIGSSSAFTPFEEGEWVCHVCGHTLPMKDGKSLEPVIVDVSGKTCTIEF